MTRPDGRSVVEVADDGIGGADITRVTGMRGLTDRVEALDGTLSVGAGPTGGTVITAAVPVPP